jgi:hypothetical protein
MSSAGRASLQSIFCTYKVNGSYTGPVFNFRRSSDGASTYFFQNSGGDFVTSVGVSLRNWAPPSAVIYVVIWYDQSKYNRYAYQWNPALQPKFNIASRYVDFKPAAYLNLVSSVFPRGNTPYTFVTQHRNINNAFGGIFGVGGNSDKHSMNFRRENSVNYNSFWWSGDITLSNAYAKDNVISETYNTTTRVARVNSVVVTSVGMTDRAGTAVDGFLGKTVVTDAGDPMNGELYFLITSDMALSESDLRTLESSQPSSQPSTRPSSQPSSRPSRQPATQPTSQPTSQPSHRSVVLSQIATFAGNGVSDTLGDGNRATSGSLNSPWGVWVDRVGNVYVAESLGNIIRRIAVTATTLSRMSGSSSTPRGIFGDTNAHLYISNAAGMVINEMDLTPDNFGRVLVGMASSASNPASDGDGGPALTTSINKPDGVWKDTKGNLYFAEVNAHKVRKVGINSIISLVAGLGVSGTNVVTVATSALLNEPCGIFGTVDGLLFIADSGNNRIRYLLLSSGYTAIFAGSGDIAPVAQMIADGPATSTQFRMPLGVTGDGRGSIFIVEFGTHRVRQITAGIATTLVGSGSPGSTGDGGPLTSANLSGPRNAFIDSAMSLYVTEGGGNRVRRIFEAAPTTAPNRSPTSQPSKQPSSRPSNQPSRQPSSHPSRQPTSQPSSHPSGQPSVQPSCQPSTQPSLRPSSQPSNYQSLQTLIDTYAGNGAQASSGNNNRATSGSFNAPQGIWGDSVGNIFVGEYFSNSLRKITVGTTILLFAGGGLACPRSLFGDTNSKLYIASFNGNRVNERDLIASATKWFVGTSEAATTGNGGQATSAAINRPGGVWKDTLGRLYFSEISGNVVRKVTVLGFVGSLAGTGLTEFDGADGMATAASLSSPFQLYGDTNNMLYVADSAHNCIRAIDLMSTFITRLLGVELCLSLLG